MNNNLQIVEQKLQHIPREKEGLRLWLRIVSCSQMVEQEVRNMLREKFDTTLPRFELLSALDRVPDGLSMGELSSWLMVTKGNVTGIAERLSEDGFIKRNPTPTDRRSFCVTLTPKGKALLVKACPLWNEAQTRAKAVLGQRGAAAVRSLGQGIWSQIGRG